MKSQTTTFYSYAVPAVLLLAGSLYILQEGKKEQKPGDKKPGAEAEMDPMAMMPKPGPEHDILRKMMGTWEAAVTMKMDENAPESKSTGVETNTMLGGFWVVQDVKGDMGGMPFYGHAMHGYSLTKKKYISVWSDSMGSDWEIFEGDMRDGKLEMRGETPNPFVPGTIMKHRTVAEFKDNDTRTYTMYEIRGDKEMKVLWIEYKRKK